MLHIEETIIVEGKYDKEKLKKITDAPIICTGGFEIYRSKQLLESIRHISKEHGVLILTDSDRAGFKIRNYLKQCLGNDYNIKNVYIPAIKGKEKRKDKAGKDGILGVEGIDEEILYELLSKVATAKSADSLNDTTLTKADLYADGLTGGKESKLLREKVAKALKLPPRISANALLDIINKGGYYDEYKKAIADIGREKTKNNFF